MPKVASRSGTFILTMRKPFTAPTTAPMARLSDTAQKAFISQTTMM